MFGTTWVRRTWIRRSDSQPDRHGLEPSSLAAALADADDLVRGALPHAILAGRKGMAHMIYELRIYRTNPGKLPVGCH